MKASKKAAFPKWAPAEAIQYREEIRQLELKYFANDPRRGGAELLYRLLTRAGMQRVWNVLPSAKKPFAYTVFAATALSGFSGPLDKEAQLTPAQHRAFLNKVRTLSLELSELLRGTYLDWRLIVDLELDHHEVGRAMWISFSWILDNVASRSPVLAAPSAGARVHGPNARRAYFVRLLTKFFREYLGGPRRELVAIATATAFDDPDFGVRQVNRLAP